MLSRIQGGNWGVLRDRHRGEPLVPADHLRCVVAIVGALCGEKIFIDRTNRSLSDDPSDLLAESVDMTGLYCNEAVPSQEDDGEIVFFVAG